MNQDADDEDGPIDSESEAALWEALEALQELGEEDPAEALVMFASLPAEVQALSDFQLARAGLLRAKDDLEEASEVLQRLLASDPEDADAHHLLGDVLEDLGETERAAVHFLETLRLDRLATSEEPEADVEAMLDETLTYLRRAVSELPAPWQERLNGVLLLVQRLPSEDMVQSGLDPPHSACSKVPRTQKRRGSTQHPFPRASSSFAENLALDFPDPEDFAEQVKITVLHGTRALLRPRRGRHGAPRARLSRRSFWNRTGLPVVDRAAVLVDRFELALDRSPEFAVRDLAREESQRARDLLLSHGASSDEAVHDFRKSMKGLHALARLVRRGLGHRFRRCNRALRDAGRLLSDLRDEEALLEALRRIAPGFPGRRGTASRGSGRKKAHDASGRAESSRTPGRSLPAGGRSPHPRHHAARNGEAGVVRKT